MSRASQILRYWLIVYWRLGSVFSQLSKVIALSYHLNTKNNQTCGASWVDPCGGRRHRKFHRRKCRSVRRPCRQCQAQLSWKGLHRAAGVWCERVLGATTSPRTSRCRHRTRRVSHLHGCANVKPEPETSQLRVTITHSYQKPNSITKTNFGIYLT